MRYILLTLGFILLVSAVVTIAKAVLPSGKTQDSAFVVLPVSGHVEDIELRVRELVRGSRGLRGAAIILADFGADGETAEICRRLCREFDTVRWIAGTALEKTIIEHTPSEEL